MSSVRHAVYIPPFGELSDPRVLADLALEAEQAKWDAVFVWDHVLPPYVSAPEEVADPWVAMAAMATVTKEITLGPMVTPIARRRPQKLAREIVTLDRLSAGRIVVGLGLGSDTTGELSRFGEVAGTVERGELLDEGSELLVRFLRGEHVEHRGRFFAAADVALKPRSYQQPCVPLWFGFRGEAKRALRRAARYDGMFPIEVDPPALARLVDEAHAMRPRGAGFDVMVASVPGVDVGAFVDAGATWLAWSFLPGQPVDEVYSFVRLGPPT